MDDSANTKYPILLVHGLFGFGRIGPFNYFKGIKQAILLSDRQYIAIDCHAITFRQMRSQPIDMVWLTRC